MAEALQLMGAPAEVVGEWRPPDTCEEEPEGCCEVYEVNREVVEVFLAAETQWRYVGFEAVPAGLDYAGVRAAAAALKVRWSRDLLDGLKIMEGAAVRALLEVRRRSRGTR